MIEKVLDYIFPKVCGLCGKFSEECLCKKCKLKIEEETLSKTEIKYLNKEFIKIMHLFKYEGDLRNILLSYKFKEKNYLYEFFVKIIIKNQKVYKFFQNYDIIIPVPLYSKKQKNRGYNQCELIATEIADNIENLQYNNKILIKSKNNLKQSSLKLSERKNNVKNAYGILNVEQAKSEIMNKRILLFDDIYTTGNTIKECTKVLKMLKPSKIGVFTIFRD